MNYETLLEQLHASHLRPSRPVDHFADEYEVHYLNMQPLKLDLSAYQPLVFRRRDTAPKSFNARLDDVLRFNRQRREDTKVMYLDADPWTTAEPRRVELAGQGVAYLDGAVMQQFLAARDMDLRYQILGTAISRTLGRLSLSPYVPGKPARADASSGAVPSLTRS